MSFSDLSNIKEHPTYFFRDKVAEICAPLFNNFPISYFNYKIKYPGNNLVTLISDGDWMYHYAQQDYNVLINGKNIHSWASTMPQQAIEDAAVKFNLYNGICIEKVHQDYIEALEFASPSPNSSPLEFCCNKELLNEFVLHFKDKTNDILKVVERVQMCLPENRFLKLGNNDVTHPSFIKFRQSTKSPKNRFKFKSKEVIFTRRQY